MAHNNGTNNGFTPRDAAEVAGVNKKTEYDNLGYMAWKVTDENGNVLVDQDGDALLASITDIRLSNPKDPKHDFYCPGLKALADMASKAGGRTVFNLQVEVKVPLPKKEKKPVSTDVLMAKLGIVQAA